MLIFYIYKKKKHVHVPGLICVNVTDHLSAYMHNAKTLATFGVLPISTNGTVGTIFTNGNQKTLNDFCCQWYHWYQWYHW